MFDYGSGKRVLPDRTLCVSFGYQTNFQISGAIVSVEEKTFSLICAIGIEAQKDNREF